MAIKIQIDLTGIDELQGKFGEDIREFINEVEQAIENTQQLVFMESQIEVPVDTGLLKSTGKAHPIVRDKDGTEGVITYGTHYAYWVHERTEIPHAGGTKAKFLEDPIKRQEDDFKKEIKSIVEKHFRG